jgi:hypothetical protein
MTVKWFFNTRCYHRSSYCNTLPSFVYIHRKKEYWIHFQFCFPSIVDLWSNLSPFFPFLQWLPFVPRFRKCFYSFPAIPLTGAIECPPLPPLPPFPLPPFSPFPIQCSHHFHFFGSTFAFPPSHPSHTSTLILLFWLTFPSPRS